MPNHCWNTLTLIGHEHELYELSQGEFKFDTFIPVPENTDNVSDWCVQNWGTKWDRWDYEETCNNDNLRVIKFTTAWNPPFAFLRWILTKFPRSWLKLEFKTEGDEAGIWIAYTWQGELVEKKMFWVEPVPALTNRGDIYIPHDLMDT